MVAVAVAALVLGWVAVGPRRFCWRVAGPWASDATGARPGGSPRPAARSVRAARLLPVGERPEGAPARSVPAGRSRARRLRAGGPAGTSPPRPAAATGRDGAARGADLLAVAVAAGCSVHEAITAAGGVCAVGTPLHDAAVGLRRGGTLTDVLDDLARGDGGGWHALATSLGVAASSGAPAADQLRRLAAAERTRARRDRERRARRLPVLLLLPLTCLVLPAFVLVTFVPFALSGAVVLDLPPAPP